MRKLAVVRNNQTDPCPYGLDITSACSSAGKLITKLVPLDFASNDEEKEAFAICNQQILAENAPGERCFYAGKIVEKLQGVECTWNTPSAGQEEKAALVGSPFYYKYFAGVGLDGLYSPPLSSYVDTTIDRPYYYGMNSIEGIASMDKDTYYQKAMNMIKNSQFIDLDGEVITLDDPEPIEDVDDLRVSLEDEIELEPVLDSPVEEKEITVPLIPGATDQSEFEEPAELSVDDEEVVVETDPMKWTVGNFLTWLGDKVEQWPSHSGRDVSGLERAIAYGNFLLGECRKATQKDIKGEIDMIKLEKLRDQIFEGTGRLEERLDQITNFKYKKKKKADEELDGLVKEAKTPNLQVQIPLFISMMARICINSTISGGHDIEQVFKKLVKKYDITEREKAEIIQVLLDMNYPIGPLDRGLIGEIFDPTSSDNMDFAAGYQA